MLTRYPHSRVGSGGTNHPHFSLVIPKPQSSLAQPCFVSRNTLKPMDQLLAQGFIAIVSGVVVNFRMAAAWSEIRLFKDVPHPAD